MPILARSEIADLLLEGDDEKVDKLDLVSKNPNEAVDRFFFLDLAKKKIPFET